MATIPVKVRRLVLARDKRCIASLLWPHVCRDAGGSQHPATYLRSLELDHIRDEAMMGDTAPSNPEHLVALCRFAHQSSGWATNNRDVLRAYLALPVKSVAAVRALRSMVNPPAYDGRLGRGAALAS